MRVLSSFLRISNFTLLPRRSSIRGHWIHLKKGSGKGDLGRMYRLPGHHGKRGKSTSKVFRKMLLPAVGLDIVLRVSQERVRESWTEQRWGEGRMTTIFPVALLLP